jgi:acetyl-CoA carboxylase biotin carboxyl carrier protein
MPEELQTPELAARVRRLAEFLASGDAVRVRIERENDEIEVARRVRPAAPVAGAAGDAPAIPETEALRLDAIKAGLVGVFRMGRPAPAEGDVLQGDRELAYIEALGIRNPVHSLGGGRIVTIAATDGQAVEYGQQLFLVDRG